MLSITITDNGKPKGGRRETIAKTDAEGIRITVDQREQGGRQQRERTQRLYRYWGTSGGKEVDNRESGCRGYTNAGETEGVRRATI